MSPRTCTICRHPERATIDKALVAGESPFRKIAEHTRTSTGALQRHRNEHLPARLLEARDAHEVASADGLLAQLRDLQSRTMAILAATEGSKDDHPVALRAIGEARRNLEARPKSGPGIQARLYRAGRISKENAVEWITCAIIRRREGRDEPGQ